MLPNPRPMVLRPLLARVVTPMKEHYTRVVWWPQKLFPFNVASEGIDAIFSRPHGLTSPQNGPDMRLICPDIAKPHRPPYGVLIPFVPHLPPCSGVHQHHRAVVRRGRIGVTPHNKVFRPVYDGRYITHNDRIQVHPDKTRPDDFRHFWRKSFQADIAAAKPAQVFPEGNDADILNNPFRLISNTAELERNVKVALDHAIEAVDVFSAKLEGIAFLFLELSVPLPANDADHSSFFHVNRIGFFALLLPVSFFCLPMSWYFCRSSPSRSKSFVPESWI